MSVFSKIRGFFGKHRNKFLISGAVVAGAVFLTRYAQQKLREWQDLQTKEFFERTKRQQHFESTERTCNQMILSLSVTLNEALNREMDVDERIAEIRNATENRVNLWESLKVVVFTKIATLIYTAVILVIVSRIQLNLLGGYIYCDAASITSEVQERYLLLCHDLLETGVKKIAKLVDDKASKILELISLKRQLTLREVEQIFWALQASIAESHDDPIEHIKNYLIPEHVPSANGDIYNKMIYETVDILESEEVKTHATSCVSKALNLLLDKVADFYVPNGAVNQPSSSDSTVQIYMVKLIPIMVGLLHKESLPDALFHQLINDDKIKVLGANIYEVFSNS